MTVSELVTSLTEVTILTSGQAHLEKRVLETHCGAHLSLAARRHGLANVIFKIVPIIVVETMA